MSIWLVAAALAGAQRDASSRADDAAARAAILAADAAHARAAERDPAGGFVSVLTEDAIYLHDGQHTLRGRVTIRAFLAAAGRHSPATLTWTPAFADVSADGALGYSYGFTQSSSSSADGTVQLVHGKYLSVWRKHGDDWRVAAYVRNPSGAAPAPAPEGFALPREHAPPRSPAADPALHVAAVRAADSAFAALSRSSSVADAFATFAAPDGVLLGAQMAYGRDAISRAFSQLPPGVTHTLRWSPTDAAAARSGDLGFTVGNAVSEVTRPDGSKRTGYTKYLTVWRKQPDGAWRFVADCGNSRPGA